MKSVRHAQSASGIMQLQYKPLEIKMFDIVQKISGKVTYSMKWFFKTLDIQKDLWRTHLTYFLLIRIHFQYALEQGLF